MGTKSVAKAPCHMAPGGAGLSRDPQERCRSPLMAVRCSRLHCRRVHASTVTGKLSVEGTEATNCVPLRSARNHDLGTYVRSPDSCRVESAW
jgi:hypothetical protein